MKLWRKEAEKHNREQTKIDLLNGDLAPGYRVSHQGRKNKVAFTQWGKAPSELPQKLFNRVGIVNHKEAKV